MVQRVALLFLTTAAPLILLVFIAPIPAGEVIFSFLAMAFPIALIALGAQHRGSLGPLLLPLVVLTLFLEACALSMLALRGQVLNAPWFGGLPLATAIQFYGVFLAPLLFVSWFYASTFERFGLRDQDLDELRRRFQPSDSASRDSASRDSANRD